MKILLTGRAGQLAQSLLRADRPKSWDMVALGRPDLDIASGESVGKAVAETAPDVIVNAAAYTAVDKAESEREAAFAINRDGPAYLAEACRERNIPLIHISTDYVYDGTKHAPWVEDDPVAPLGVYGASKLAGEEAVKERLEQYIILRTAWVYSPFGHNFVKTMLRLAGERDELGVVDDQIGNPSYAPHLASAIITLLERLEVWQGGAMPWGIYHMAGKGEASWFDLAREVFARSQERGGPFAHVRAIGTKDYPTPARRPANSRLDCRKLEKNFGIGLPDWRTGVAECVDAILRQREGTS